MSHHRPLPPLFFFYSYSRVRPPLRSPSYSTAKLQIVSDESNQLHNNLHPYRSRQISSDDAALSDLHKDLVLDASLLLLSRLPNCRFPFPLQLPSLLSLQASSFMNSCSHLFLAIALRSRFPKILERKMHQHVSRPMHETCEFDTYQRGIVRKQTNRKSEPRMQKTTSGPCSASQSLTKYVRPNVNLPRLS